MLQSVSINQDYCPSDSQTVGLGNYLEGLLKQLQELWFRVPRVEPENLHF